MKRGLARLCWGYFHDDVVAILILKNLASSAKGQGNKQPWSVYMHNFIAQNHYAIFLIECSTST